jgi:uncharacterized protein YceK
MKKTAIASVIVALMMSGCATIVDGSTQAITFKSAPDGATISITNRAGKKLLAGTTPVTLTLERGAGYFASETYSVRIEKAGYQPKDMVIAGTVNGWYVANILFGGWLGLLIVDPISGAMYDLTPDAVSTTLDAMNVKTSGNERSLTVVLAQDLPAEAWKSARLIKTN